MSLSQIIETMEGLNGNEKGVLRNSFEKKKCEE